MFSKTHLLFLLIFIGSTYSFETEYHYHISEGNNFFDLEQWELALTHYKKAIQIKEAAADAYFQIGHIHLLKGFNKAALKNFKKAESFSNHFLIKETLLELYLHISATYHREKYLEQEVDYLYKILGVATNYQAAFYREQAGKALFLLGLLEINKGKKAKAKQYFLKATVYPYRLKSCFLYITHYYAVTPQETIDADIKELFPQIKRTENRDIFFNHYYKKYQNTPLSAEEEDTFEKTSYQFYLQDIEEYKRLQQAKRDTATTSPR